MCLNTCFAHIILLIGLKVPTGSLVLAQAQGRTISSPVLAKLAWPAPPEASLRNTYNMLRPVCRRIRLAAIEATHS